MELYDINRIDTVLKHEFGHLFVPEGRGIKGDQLIYEGRLKQDTVSSLVLLVTRFKEIGYDVSILGTGPRIILKFTLSLQDIVTYQAAAKEEKFGLHILLFFITFLSSLCAGLALKLNILDIVILVKVIIKDPLKIWMGWPFAIPLMMILMAHEMGHYIFALKYKIRATLPYFIPFPNIIGTMGAVIKMKSRIPDRKALMDIGMAGPLAGAFLAIPVTIIGLKLSTITTVTASSNLTGVYMLGDSLLFKFLTWIVHGSLPPNGNVIIHPMAFAGWVGLLVTFMNLFPASQLDGGHISYALFGPVHKTIGKITCFVFAIMGLFYWPWFIWMLFVFFIGLGHPPPVNDIEPIGTKRRILGILCLVLFVLTCIPRPFYGDELPTSLVSLIKALGGIGGICVVIGVCYKKVQNVK
ncbi:MAG: site-2 protease family protein [bacterium]